MEKYFFSTTVKIKADIETLMHLKAINIFIIIIFLLFTACAEGNNQNNSINNESTKYDLFSFVVMIVFGLLIDIILDIITSIA